MLPSSETSGKPSSSVLTFPRIPLKELKEKTPMEAIVEEKDENGENGKGKHKLNDGSDKTGLRGRPMILARFTADESSHSVW
ncbi:coiled-coil domain-containing protein 81-like [Suricata suricatta]|uniref:coiled-coil domain-containing protein 81-like n=1 Tax=Suricata suricatta TaxID=37032 RepID=UPI001156C1C0|nr:coiled-coil domain-containing protein 81-like [Suricata suricatta]